MLSCGFYLMYEDIIRTLSEAGEHGLSLQNLVLHVHHANNNLFHQVEMEEVRQRVIQYLRANTRFSGSLIERTHRGIYRLNPNSDEARQLLLSFDEGHDDISKGQTPTPLGPSLFD